MNQISIDEEGATTAYERGWADGYDDVMSDNPYPEGTEQYDSYILGYEQGSMDC